MVTLDTHTLTAYHTSPKICVSQYGCFGMYLKKAGKLAAARLNCLNGLSLFVQAYLCNIEGELWYICIFLYFTLRSVILMTADIFFFFF